MSNNSQNSKNNSQNQLIKKSSRGRQPNGEANPIDIHVGNRIRIRRQLLGLSQEKLAALLGLTFQQVQKYERGMNRVGASRLWDIGKVLGVHIGFFYEEINKDVANQSPRMFCLPANFSKELLEEYIEESDIDPMAKSETIALVKDYYKIPNRKMAKVLAEAIHQASKYGYNLEDENRKSGL